VDPVRSQAPSAPPPLRGRCRSHGEVLGFRGCGVPFVSLEMAVEPKGSRSRWFRKRVRGPAPSPQPTSTIDEARGRIGLKKTKEPIGSGSECVGWR
jgi:hypothetical protein